MFVTLMQLYDTIFWKTQGISSQKANEITTKMAILTNHLQPLILGCLFYVIKGKIGKWSKLCLLLYSIVIIPYTIQCFIHPDSQVTKVTEKSKPSLYWAWNHLTGGGIVYSLYLLTLLVCFMENCDVGWIKYIAIAITSFSFLFTYVKYEKTFYTGGRFWCYFGAFLVWIFVIGYLLQLLYITKKQ